METDRGELYRENELFLSRDKGELAALFLLPGMTRGRFYRLIKEYRSPRDLWAAIRAGEQLVGCEAADCSRWNNEALRIEPCANLDDIKKRSIGIVVPGEQAYPPLLLQLIDPPVVLYYRGNLPAIGSAFVSIVGARKASAYGIEVTRWLAESLCGYSSDMVIVSGAATGIDTAAHLGALKAGGMTLAVLGCGVDVVYPRSNARLLERIAERSCILSEYPPGTGVRKHHFPERNRIIAGLSAVTVVTEAAEGSGSIITAEQAIYAGRTLFSVPGPLFSVGSSATNAMIKNGASLLNDPVDVINVLYDGLQLSLNLSSDDSCREADALRKGVLEAIVSGASEPGELANIMGFSAADALSTLACLELEGKVNRGAGGRYQVVRHTDVRKNLLKN